MGKPKNTGERRSLGGPEQGLGHNPFAGLSGGTGRAPGETLPDANAPDGAAAQVEPEGTEVIVRRERKGRGGKGVILIEGLPRPIRKPMAKAAARALGTGARLEADALVIQGDQADRVSAWLVAQGYTVKRAN